MGFAANYLEKRSLFSDFILSAPSSNLGMAIVIPCFNEPDILPTLESLWKCERPDCVTEVIVVVNSPENAPVGILETNNKTIADIENWQKSHVDEWLKFQIISVPDLPQKDAGVGLARKIGMDEAVSRFNQLESPNGILVGFDADSGCDPNYLTAIHSFFQKHKNLDACSIHFEHPVEGDEFEPEVYRRIVQYELYLRYYINALRYAHFPYSFQTIGSSFAVRAKVYAMQGGMNKKKAGEDFYFLQKIIPLGHFRDLTETRVIPSPRPSDRVPFGTGAAIAKMTVDDFEGYLTYDFRAFDDIRMLVNNCGQFYKKTTDEAISLLQSTELFPETIRQFLMENGFEENLPKINENSSSMLNFYKRFFAWFSAFQALKFLNFVHPQPYQKQDITHEAYKLAQLLSFQGNADASAQELLRFYRDFDRQNIFHLKYPSEHETN